MQLLKYSGREPGHYPTEKMIDPKFKRKCMITVRIHTVFALDEKQKTVIREEKQRGDYS
mgnify:CR=1 FL=1